MNYLLELMRSYISAGVISAVIDLAWTEIIELQQRPLYSCYSIMYLYAIHYKKLEKQNTL